VKKPAPATFMGKVLLHSGKAHGSRRHVFVLSFEAGSSCA